MCQSLKPTCGWGAVEDAVERSVIHGAIAEKRDGHVLLFENLERVPAAARLQNGRPDDAAGAHQTDLRREEVHTSAATKRNAGRNGFFTDVRVARAKDNPPLMKPRELFFGLPDGLHRPVEFEPADSIDARFGFSGDVHLTSSRNDCSTPPAC